jgi:hypothetical protein
MTYIDNHTMKMRIEKIRTQNPVSTIHGISSFSLKQTSQPYPLLYDALLYGAHCEQAHIIPLPLDHGILKMFSLDDLIVNWWLKGGPSGGHMGNNFADLAQYRHTITHHPSSPQLHLKHAYTIFVPEFPICQNLLLE